MNRDRTVIVVLAILLAASLALNWRSWQKAHDGGTAPVGTVTPMPAETRKSPPSERGAQGAYDIVANPELKGRLGRIVLAFADDAKIGGTLTKFYRQSGAEVLRSDYGVVAAELAPATYDLEVCGKRISGIPVESGKDTRIRSGVLRLHGANNTLFGVFDAGAKDHFHTAYGNAEFGLPAGGYEVEVSGQREKVTIESGKITDY